MNDIETNESANENSEVMERPAGAYPPVQNIEAPLGGLGGVQPFSAADGDPRAEKRRTVNVFVAPASVPVNGIQLRLHRSVHDGDGFMADPEHDPIILKPGHNPGMDKEFFDRWRDQNKDMAERLSILAVDEESGDEDRLQEGQDERNHDPETENNEHEE